MAEQDVVLEILKRIQVSLSNLEEGQRQILVRLGAVERDVAGIKTDIAGINARLDGIDERVRRIERRLDLIGSPES